MPTSAERAPTRSDTQQGPGRAGLAGTLTAYDAAMRVATWRWLLVPMIVVAAACLPRPSASTLEAAFTRYLDAAGMTFTPADPGEGVMSAEEVVAAVQSTTGADRLAGLAAVPLGSTRRIVEDQRERPP